MRKPKSDRVVHIRKGQIRQIRKGKSLAFFSWSSCKGTPAGMLRKSDRFFTYDASDITYIYVQSGTEQGRWGWVKKGDAERASDLLT